MQRSPYSEKSFPIIYALGDPLLPKRIEDDTARIDSVAERFLPSLVVPTVYTAMLAGELGIYRQLIEGAAYTTELLIPEIRGMAAYRLYKRRFNPSWKIPRARNGLGKLIQAETDLWDTVYKLLVNLPAYYPDMEFPHPLETIYFLSLDEQLIMPYRFKEPVGSATKARSIVQGQNRQLQSGENPFPDNSPSYYLIELARHQAWDAANNEFFRSSFWNPMVKARQQISNITKSGMRVIDLEKGMVTQGGNYKALRPLHYRDSGAKKVFVDFKPNLLILLHQSFRQNKKAP
jgi:hypothetical protein